VYYTIIIEDAIEVLITEKITKTKVIAEVIITTIVIVIEAQVVIAADIEYHQIYWNRVLHHSVGATCILHGK